MEKHTNWTRVAGFRSKRAEQVARKLSQLTSYGHNVRPVQDEEYYYIEMATETYSVEEGAKGTSEGTPEKAE